MLCRLSAIPSHSFTLYPSPLLRILSASECADTTYSWIPINLSGIMLRGPRESADFVIGIRCVKHC